MVAASQPLAVQAGIDILALGGNAADAAVATAAALNVTEPSSTGIGGDCFALYYDAESREITALNGSGRAPSALTLDLLETKGFGESLPPYHALTVTVPGACAGWSDLLERHGRLDLRIALAPAINLAEEGFPVSPLTAYYWQRGAERQLRNAPGGEELTIDGLDPQAALDRPRVNLTEARPGSPVAVEGGIPDETVRGLAQMGHEVEVVTGHMRAIFGRGQVILRDMDTGVLCGGSDPRADGCAIPLA